MTVDSAIARFRERQASLFRDDATVTRGGGGGTLDPNTGIWTPNTGTTVYSGPCLFRSAASAGIDVQLGGTEIRLRQTQVKFPANTPVQVDDMVIPTVSTYDAALVGVPFRVTDVIRDGWQIARVCILEEETRDV